MRKIRNGFVFLLTAVVIVFCARLPQIIAELQESLSEEKVEYEDIKTVTFQQDLNTVEKLFLLRDGLAVSVSEDSASKTSKQVEELARSGLERYMGMGLLYTPSEFFEVYSEPVLHFNSDSNDMSWIFWDVTMIYGDEQEEIIRLQIDDVTGEIFRISYETLYPIYDEVIYEDSLVNFYGYFLENLQLWEFADEPYVEENTAFDVTDIGAIEPDEDHIFETEEKVDMLKKSGSVIVVRFGDIVYGEMNLNFCFYSNGFFVSFS